MLSTTIMPNQDERSSGGRDEGKSGGDDSGATWLWPAAVGAAGVIGLAVGWLLAQLGEQEEENELREEEQGRARVDVMTRAAPDDGQANDDAAEYELEECVVCMVNKKTVLLLPCKHVSVCKQCSWKLTECPSCRKPIEDRVRVFC